MPKFEPWLQPDRTRFDGPYGSTRDVHADRLVKVVCLDAKPRGATDVPPGNLKFPGPFGASLVESAGCSCNYCGSSHVWPCCGTMLTLDVRGRMSLEFEVPRRYWDELQDCASQCSRTTGVWVSSEGTGIGRVRASSTHCRDRRSFDSRTGKTL